MNETPNSQSWAEVVGEAISPEQKRCAGEAEENANASTWEGVTQFSEEWFSLCLNTYEFLIDNGTYADA